MSDYTLPSYSGSMPQPAQAITAPNLAGITRPAAGLAAETVAKGMQAAATQAADFTAAAIERNDYTIDTMRQMLTEEVQNNVNATMRERLQLPDGHPQALYDSNGMFREKDYADLRTKLLAPLNGLAEGYLGTDARAKANTAVSHIRRQLSGEMDATLAGQMSERAANAVKRRATALAAQGRFGEARAVVAAAPSFAMDPDTQTVMQSEINSQEGAWVAQQCVNNGDISTLLAIAGNEEVMNSYDPATQARILAAIQNCNKKSGEITIDRKTGKVTKTAAELPYGVPDYVYDYYQGVIRSGGDFKDGRHAAAAQGVLDRYVEDVCTTPGDVDQESKARLVASYFGEPAKEYVNKKIEDLKKADKHPFNIENNLAAIGDEYLFSKEYLDKGKQLQTKQNSLVAKKFGKGKITPKQEQALIKISNELKLYRENIKETSKRLRSEIKAEYHNWLNTAEGSKATPYQCHVKMLDIVESKQRAAAKSGATFKFVRQDPTILASINNAQQEAENRTLQAKEAAEALQKNAAATDERRRQAEEADTAAVLTCNTDTYNTTNLPDSTSQALLYVPKGDKRAGRQIHLKNGNTSINVDVKEADVDTPALSVNAQARLNLYRSGISARALIITGKEGTLINPTDIPPSLIDNQNTPDDGLLPESEVYGTEPPEESGEIVYGLLPEDHEEGNYEEATPVSESGVEVEGQATAAQREKAQQQWLAKTQTVADWLLNNDLHEPALEYLMRSTAATLRTRGTRAILTRMGMQSDETPDAFLASALQSKGLARTLAEFAAARRAENSTAARNGNQLAALDRAAETDEQKILTLLA